MKLPFYVHRRVLKRRGSPGGLHPERYAACLSALETRLERIRARDRGEVVEGEHPLQPDYVATEAEILLLLYLWGDRRVDGDRLDRGGVLASIEAAVESGQIHAARAVLLRELLFARRDDGRLYDPPRREGPTMEKVFHGIRPTLRVRVGNGFEEVQNPDYQEVRHWSRAAWSNSWDYLLFKSIATYPVPRSWEDVDFDIRWDSDVRDYYWKLELGQEGAHHVRVTLYAVRWIRHARLYWRGTDGQMYHGCVYERPRYVWDWFDDWAEELARYRDERGRVRIYALAEHPGSGDALLDSREIDLEVDEDGRVTGYQRVRD